MNRDERSEPSRPVADLAGPALLGAAAGWTFVAAAIERGDPGPPAALLGASAGTLVLGRLIGGRVPWLVPAVVASVGLAVAARSPAETFSRKPLAGFLGYANAKGAFFAVAAIAALMAAAGARWRGWRWVWGIAALPLAAVPFVTRALAAAALVVLAPVAALAVHRRPRALAAGGGAVIVLALVATAAIGWVYEDGEGPFGSRFEETVSERRAILWGEAILMMRLRPLAGVGPGQFAAVSPTAQADPDARWAHHGFFQVGAETGLAGLAFVVGAFLWGCVRLGMGTPDEITALGVAVVAALGVGACIDYVLHFAAVPIAAAALVGAASAPRRAPQLEPEGEAPWMHS